MPETPRPSLNLVRFAWIVLIYLLGTIVWGAYVRASGSGAGCGEHWPLCNGTVLPRAVAIQTWIEFSHRATSGLSLLLVLTLGFWARCKLPVGHLGRKAAAWSVAFILSEALLGAGLVLFQLVAHNQSATRAFSLALHLTNTFLLLAAVTATAYWSAKGAPRFSWHGWRDRNWSVAAWIACVVTGAAGAVTALGDTLFITGTTSLGAPADPHASLMGRVLIQLRVVHPVLAIAFAGYVFAYADRLRSKWMELGHSAAQFPWALSGLVFLQVGLGMTNIFLRAPVCMQLVHLAVADSIWIGLVLAALMDYDAD